MSIEFHPSFSTSPISYTAEPGADFTITGWFKPVSIPGSFNGVITLGPASGANYNGVWYTSGYGLDLLSGTGSDTAFFTGADDTWFFLALVFDSGEANEMIAYARADGDTSLTASTRVNQDNMAATDEFWIGYSNFDEPFSGDASCFKIWDGVLTEAECYAESLFIRPVNFANLWAWLPAWSEIDTTDGTATGNLLDYSGNNNHATTGTLRPIDNVLGTNVPLVSYGLSTNARILTAAVSDPDLNLIATLVDVAVIDINTSINLSRILTPTVVAAIVADLNSTIQLGANLSLMATQVDIAISAVTSSMNLSRELATVLVDMAIADLNSTIAYDKVLAATLVNISVSDIRAIVDLTGIVSSIINIVQNIGMTIPQKTEFLITESRRDIQ